MPALETFIELETALAKVLHRRWERAAAAAWPGIYASWQRKDYPTAIELIGAIQQEPHTIPEIRKARALCTAMLAYGASFVSDDRAKKWVGPKIDPEPANQMLRQMEGLAVQDAPAFAVRMARAEIKRQEGEEGRTPEAAFLQLVAKADIPSSYQARNVIMSGGRWSSDLTANLVTSRLVNYGSLDAMRDDGIQTYRLEATLDTRTSQICRNLHGRVFTVREGFNRVEAALRTEDGEALRAVHPWIPNNMASTLPDLTRREMTEQGWLVPPFHPRCYADGTRVMTRRGFIDFSDVDIETDEFWSLDPTTRKPDWVKAHNKIQKKHVGEMARLSNSQGSVSLLVTPDHPMFYDRRVDTGKGREWRLQFGTLESFSCSPENKLYVTSEPDDTGETTIMGEDAADVCAFLGWFASEGYMRGRFAHIVQHKPEGRAEIEALLKRIALGGHEVWKERYEIRVPGLNQLAKLCGKGAKNKRIPERVFGASLEARKAFLAAYAAGDGHCREQRCFEGMSQERVFTTSSAGMRDDLVRLLISVGRSASVREEPRKTVTHENGTYTSKGVQYRISDLSSARRAANLSTEHYEGWVWDVSLDRNHTLLIEHNGCVSWGSNCRTIAVPAAFNEADVADLFDDIPNPADILFGRRTGSLLSNNVARAAIGVALTGATVVGSIVLFDLIETGLLARTFRNVGSRLLELRSWQLDDIIADVAGALRRLSVNGTISPIDFDRAVRSTLSRYDIDPRTVAQAANDVLSSIGGVIRR